MIRNVLVIVFSFLGIFAFSMEDNRVIGSITISGLKRTRESVIYNLLEVNEGDRFSKFNEERFKQELLKTGILRPGEISYNEHNGYIDINIEIDEKWTLLPIPMISISGESQSYRFIIMEQNFLGLRKMLFINTGYSTQDGLTGGIMYRDIDILPSDLYLFVSGFINKNRDKFYLHTLGNIGIGKEINEFGLSAFLKYDHFLFDSSEQSEFVSNSFSISYKDIYYTSTMQTGTSLSLTLTSGWDITESAIYMNLNSSISYRKEMFSNLYLAGRLSSQHFDSPFLLERSWGGSDNSRTLAPVLCDQYIGGSFLLEYTFLNFGWGVISSNIQYELGGYQHNSDNWIMYTGPGTGLRLYLKKIAIPAVGLDVAYNTIDNNFLFTVAIGMKR